MSTVKLLHKHFKQLKYYTCSNWYYTLIQLLPVTNLCITQQQIEGIFWRCCIAFGYRYVLQIHYGLLLKEHLPRIQESLECDCYKHGCITHICLKQAKGTTDMIKIRYPKTLCVDKKLTLSTLYHVEK